MKRSSSVIATIAIVLVVLGIGVLVWRRQPIPVPVEVALPPPAPPASVGPALAPVASASAAIQYPIETPVAAEASAAPPDVESALIELFGRKTVLSMFLVQDFPNRFVATVDNLGRSHAPARTWPVHPADGRFLVEARDGASTISADNGLRYTPYVLLLETVNLNQAAAAYIRLYPLFQQAYVELGFPKQYFNDRFVEVIDQMLATPESSEPLKVHLPPINGPMQPSRPWVLYEFDDPALQSLSAGQKLLLRMGPINERRMKTKLAEIRRLVTAGTLPR